MHTNTNTVIAFLRVRKIKWRVTAAENGRKEGSKGSERADSKEQKEGIKKFLLFLPKL